MLRKIIPGFVFNWYHLWLAFLGALIYGFPSKKIFVLGATGTKGKTTILEIANAILEEAGYKTALMSTLRFKIAKETWPNNLKMTMPGRFFVQKFLRRAVNAGCQYVLLEMTSQGVLQSRHKFISLDAMLFSNLAPEHIEAHGSFENYRAAKLKLFKALERSLKSRKIIIVNADDENAGHFLRFKTNETWLYGLSERNSSLISAAENQRKLFISEYKLREEGTDIVIGKHSVHSPLLGEFNLYNILAAIAFAKSQSVGWITVKKALEKFSGVPGRLEFIKEGQDFKVVVDYAHTPDSLEKVYELFQTSRRICVLGAAGGGRDKWKRPLMGKIAAANCDEIILANEDPYDEDPYEILSQVKSGISESQFPVSGLHEILDRREAIRKALSLAKIGDTVIITGKGSEPWIVGPNGTKTKWDDREAAREELKKILMK